MRIGTIYTIYNHRAGVELFFERTVKEITKSKIDIELIIFCNKQGFDILKYEKGMRPIFVKALDSQYTKYFWLEYFSEKVIRKHKIDLFWLPSGTNSFPGRWEIPVVTTIHDIGEYHIKNKYDAVRTFYRTKICVPRSLKRSDKIIAASRFTASDIRKTLKYGKDISVIYEAADPWSEEDSNACADVVKQKIGNFFEKIILCVGRTDFIGKGIDIILSGYSDILAKDVLGHIPPLVFVGPKGEKSSLLNGFIKKLKFEKNIYYLGRVSNKCLESLYDLAIVNILASRYEGFGITVLESLKRDIPIICSDLPVFKEIAGNAPIFFKSGNSSDFAQRLSDMLNGKIDLKTKQEIGQTISAKYNWGKTAREYIDIFKTFAHCN